MQILAEREQVNIISLFAHKYALLFEKDVHTNSKLPEQSKRKRT